MTIASKFCSYSVFITVAVCMFQVASNESDDIPDENSNNSFHQNELVSCVAKMECNRHMDVQLRHALDV